MKKAIVLFMSLILMFSVTACGDKATPTPQAESKTKKACKHEFSDATCTEPATCTLCGETGSVTLGHSFTNEKSCTEERVCERCGEKQAALGHDWIAATCEQAKHCSLCDIIEGEKIGHNFVNGCCSFCKKTVIITMPSLPKKISELKYNGEIESTVEISDISYEITEYIDDDYSVEFTICGKKLYDAKGDNHSRETTLGYKLYDLDGMVIYSGTLLTTSVSVGETFSRSLPYEGMRVKGISAGEYRLEIFDSQ